MPTSDAAIIDELDLLWRVRFGQPLPIRAEPAVIIRVMRMVEEKRLAEEAPPTAKAG